MVGIFIDIKGGGQNSRSIDETKTKKVRFDIKFWKKFTAKVFNMKKNLLLKSSHLFKGLDFRLCKQPNGSLVVKK